MLVKDHARLFVIWQEMSEFRNGREGDLGGSEEAGSEEDFDDPLHAGLHAAGAPPQEKFQGAVPGRGAEKRIRDRKAEKVTKDILTMTSASFIDAHGVVDAEKVRLVLRSALGQIEPASKDWDENAAIVSVLKAGLAAQDSSSISAGVNRALTDTMAGGVARGLISGRGVEKKLGVSRKRLREGSDIFDPSFSESAQKKRKPRRDKIPLEVRAAMKEFVYCYCKYLEKTFVCLLTKQMVFDLYNQFHDKEGRYYCHGKPPPHPAPHPTHAHTQAVQLGWIGT